MRYPGGHFIRDLSTAHSSFSLVVQDLPRVIDVAQEANRDSGFGNVAYQAHNFFHKQPVESADVYFLRHIFHNHPDKECVEILKALLPALKTGSRVLVSEYIVPPSEDLKRGTGEKAMR